MRIRILWTALISASLTLVAACDASSSDVSALRDRLEALEGEVSTLRTQLASTERDASNALTKSSAGEDTLVSWQASLEFCRDLAAVVSLDSEGDVVIDGANLHIRSGLGATRPSGGDTNGKGNLIIGYNEMPEDEGDLPNRDGSHNLVVGPEHSYSASGAVIFGQHNTVDAPHAAILGGQNNVIQSGDNGFAIHSVVVGGLANRAADHATVVVGGVRNVADGLASMAVGGADNTSSGRRSVVLGGHENHADDERTTILGGNGVTDNSTAGSIFPAPTERWGSAQPQ